jgi:hypothetical protein
MRSIAVRQITQGGGDLPVEREADSNSYAAQMFQYLVLLSISGENL